MKAVFLLLGIFFFTQVFPHSIIIGKVIDLDTNAPLVGATVIIQNTEYGTITDNFGKFILKSESSDIALDISFIGYQNQTIIVDETNAEIIIRLKATTIKLEQVSIKANTIDNLHSISKVDVNLKPAKSSQEVLRTVPGLFVAQHAGGGKAEQIFLRGFDIDHGTDVAISVDGIPVNMVSHAHGQGYADLHFLIPELINKVDFGKGPYFTEYGNLANAGFVNFETLKHLDQNRIQLEGGLNNTMRILAMTELLNSKSPSNKQNAFIATEYMLTDGPFESSQNFNRINIFAKYLNYLDDNNLLSIQISTFKSKWDASGQIPQRAIDQNIISRFGSIDDTEGGFTNRSNVMANLISYLENGATTTNSIYYTRYNFELYSNFTFFLEDPINGDQIRQKEARDLFGYKFSYNKNYDFDLLHLNSTIKTGFRYDDINDIELSHTKERLETINQISFGDIDETNAFLILDETFQYKKLLVNIGTRLDFFKFDYLNKLSSTYDLRTANKFKVSPKINLSYNYSKKWQLYLKTGKGFHSNDARSILNNSSIQILPSTYGVDLGTIFKPAKRLLSNIAIWYLYMEDELVFVGDAGIVEESGKTQRFGIDLSIRYQITDWLYSDIDLNYANPKSLENPAGQNYIPLAPIFSSTGGVYFKLNNINGGIRYRHLGDRPANEDNSIIAEKYTVLDANLNYKIKNFELGFMIENLLNTEWKETQFETESRLYFEPNPVTEIHFIPGTPFFIKIKGTFFF